jgi:uncharacterized LabA/DUF88 family protein
MRISVFVDGANFFYMQKDVLRWWIDPKRFLDYVRTMGDLVDAVYYVGIEDPLEDQQDRFLKFLVHVGFSLETKELKTVVQNDGNERKKANLDIEIVLDLFNTIDHYDLAVIVSGDGDFRRPLRLLKARGKRFLVMSTQGVVAKEIRDVAGMHFTDFQSIRSKVEKIRGETANGS